MKGKAVAIMFLSLMASVSCIEPNNRQTDNNDVFFIDSMFVDGHMLLDYSDYIEGYIPSEGFLPDADTAVKVAEAILFRIYGEANICDERPYKVALKDDIWCLEGNLPEGMVGGVFYIELDKHTGQVIKMLHTK